MLTTPHGHHGPSQRPPTTEDGQALVEFSLVLPVLVLILLSVVQLGFIFGAHIGVINAVREAARYGSLSPTLAGQVDANGTAVQGYLTGTLLPQSVPAYRADSVESTSVTYCSYPNPGAGSYSVRLTVTANYAHPLFIPLVAALLDGFDATPGALVIPTSERFRVENVPLNATEVAGLTACP